MIPESVASSRRWRRGAAIVLATGMAVALWPGRAAGQERSAGQEGTQEQKAARSLADAPRVGPASAPGGDTGAGEAEERAADAAGAEPESADAEEDGITAFVRDIEVLGFVDGYYGFNFNRVAGDAPLRNFDTLHNQFGLNLAEIALERRPAAGEFGFRIDLNVGSAAEMVHASEPGGEGLFSSLQQGYISYLAPLGRGLQIDGGKFVTPHGAEVIETHENWNYSRSFLFALAIPYYHMGARVGYAFHDRFALTGFVVNGWNNVVENNGAKTFGVQAVVTPAAALSVSQTYMRGPEQEENDDDVREVFDTVVTWEVTPRLSLMANYDFGRDRLANASVRWQGVAFYGRWQPTDRWALSPRVEWYDDRDGFTTGLSQRLRELTLTAEHRVAGQVVTRVEYRHDASDAPFFLRRGRPARSQRTLTFGFIYAFTTGAS